MTPGARQPGRRLLATLIVLTMVSGLVDAVSYLGLGHVFTANMTGNVVLLGFAAAAMLAGAFAGASAFLHAGAAAGLAIGAFVVLVSGVAFWAAAESRRLDQPASAAEAS